MLHRRRLIRQNFFISHEIDHNSRWYQARVRSLPACVCTPESVCMCRLSILLLETHLTLPFKRQQPQIRGRVDWHTWIYPPPPPAPVSRASFIPPMTSDSSTLFIPFPLKSNLWIRKQPGDSQFYQIMYKWCCTCIVYVCQKPLSPFKTKKKTHLSISGLQSDWWRQTQPCTLPSERVCLRPGAACTGTWTVNPRAFHPLPVLSLFSSSRGDKNGDDKEHLGDGCPRWNDK